MKYIALAVVVLCVGCTTTTLTPEGKLVRTIDTSQAVQCRHIGLVSSSHRIWTGSYESSDVDVRNKTAAAGGNALVLLPHHNEFGAAIVNGEAYACQF